MLFHKRTFLFLCLLNPICFLLQRLPTWSLPQRIGLLPMPAWLLLQHDIWQTMPALSAWALHWDVRVDVVFGVWSWLLSGPLWKHVLQHLLARNFRKVRPCLLCSAGFLASDGIFHWLVNCCCCCHVFSDRGMPLCRPCPAGSEALIDGAIMCTLCPAGTNTLYTPHGFIFNLRKDTCVFLFFRKI